MGRVPKKHRRAVEYTEAVDSDEINKSNGENKEEEGANEEVAEKNIEKSDDEDDFRSIHDSDGDGDNKEAKASKDTEKDTKNEGSDDEPLKKVARLTKTPKKAIRKTAKKTTPKKEEEYEVHSIVGHKVQHGEDYYLVRWKGYTKDDDTWEPFKTLSCPQLIESFKKKQSTNNDKPKKKLTNGDKKGRSPAKTARKQEDLDKQWEVDKIIDYAQEKSGRIFRIRWKGFGPKHDTWEPEKNLSCDEVIAKFMQRIKSQEFVSFKELREAPKKPKRLVNETAPPTNYTNAIGRKSKRGTRKNRVFYGDSD